jgi:hypothetical protein
MGRLERAPTVTAWSSQLFPSGRDGTGVGPAEKWVPPGMGIGKKRIPVRMLGHSEGNHALLANHRTIAGSVFVQGGFTSGVLGHTPVTPLGC